MTSKKKIKNGTKQHNGDEERESGVGTSSGSGGSVNIVKKAKKKVIVLGQWQEMGIIRYRRQCFRREKYISGEMIYQLNLWKICKGCWNL